MNKNSNNTNNNHDIYNEWKDNGGAYNWYEWITKVSIDNTNDSNISECV